MSKKLITEEHLTAAAVAVKNYTKDEIAKIGGLSAVVNDFTGATSITGGTSGLVPAPQVGDQDKFLCCDGTWAAVQGVTIGGASALLALSNTPSTVNGAMWIDSSVASSAATNTIILPTLMPNPVVNGSMWIDL